MVLMLLDNISNLRCIYLPNILVNWLQFASKQNFDNQDDGVYYYDYNDADNRYKYTITTLNTRKPEDAFWESHRQYVDIQYLLKGVEVIQYAPINQLIQTDAYDASIDMIKYSKDHGSELILHPGDFAIFYPQDGHKPMLHYQGQTNNIRKIIVKIPVEFC